jgi:hypothetical protein
MDADSTDEWMEKFNSSIDTSSSSSSSSSVRW